MRCKLIILLFFCLLLINEVEALSLLKPIPNFTWEEDSDLDNAFDLDDYFSGIDLAKYEYLEARAGSLAHFQVEIDNENEVSFSADSGFRGFGYVLFNASNSSESLLSNEVMLNITQKQVFEISSFSPQNTSLNLIVGSVQVFSVSVPDKAKVKWFLDSKLISEERSYSFNALNLGDHDLEAVISKGGETIKQEWKIKVTEIKLPSLNITLPEIPKTEVVLPEIKCGNRVKDEGEDCGNCPEDVKCAENAVCKGNVCVPLAAEKEEGVNLYLIFGIILAIGGIAVGVLFLLKRRKRVRIVRNVVEERRRVVEEKIEDLTILRDYFKANITKYSLEELKRSALQQGWREEQINKVVQDVSKVEDVIKPLEDYIRQSLKTGYKREEIEAAAIGQGWSREQVNEAFRRIENA
jgi:hypothetical protein